jgi:hypothetical protein
MQQTHKTQDIKFEFRIHDIQILQFSLDNSREHPDLGANHPYTFDISSSVLLDSALKLIAIDFNVKLFTNKEKSDKVCELTVRMSFNILNYDEIVKIDGGKVNIPEPVIHHLIALTLSTSRGILFDKLQGSFLSSVIMPIFNVTEFKKAAVEQSANH